MQGVTAIDVARIQALEAEMDRLWDERIRITDQIARVRRDITWSKYHNDYPIGSRHLRRGRTLEIVGYGENYPVAKMVKVDGTLGAKSVIFYPSDAS